MREQYIQMRRNSLKEGFKFDLNWFYQYYLQNRDLEKECVSGQQFAQAFSLALQFIPGPIFEHLDKKFDVTIVEDKNGNIINIA